MKSWAGLLHGLILISWLGCGLYLAMQIAAHGCQEDRLERQRGEYLVTRQKLNFARIELRSAIDWASRREVIEPELRRLRLPLVAPPDEGPATATLAVRDDRPAERP